ncbi:carboxypeptidase-like regulatory domain-containing protein [Nocardioides convexus]|uniref:carboxypeptidase-like regulatory domain-containing protein n=1 Tax=Nocardioides convexus TaxID=2712224 RepID=UPI0024187E2C|nr:carboxypeptidase-like regulatory domain-containing protein [Nocardioides convexus]
MTVATATPGEIVERDLTVTPLRVVTLSGRATAESSGAPVAGVEVHVVRENDLRDERPLATTAADGTWSLTTGLRADEGVWVCFDAERPGNPTSATGFSNQCIGGADFDPAPRTTTADRRVFGTATAVSSSGRLDIALRPTRSVTGRVQDSDGVPLGGAVVLVRKPSTEITYSATTDATGRYAVAVGIRRSVWDGMVRICSDPDAAYGRRFVGRVHVVAVPGAIHHLRRAPGRRLHRVAGRHTHRQRAREHHRQGCRRTDRERGVHHEARREDRIRGEHRRRQASGPRASCPARTRRTRLCTSGLNLPQTCVPLTALGIAQAAYRGEPPRRAPGRRTAGLRVRRRDRQRHGRAGGGCVGQHLGQPRRHPRPHRCLGQVLLHPRHPRPDLGVDQRHHGGPPRVPGLGAGERRSSAAPTPRSTSSWSRPPR